MYEFLVVAYIFSLWIVLMTTANFKFDSFSDCCPMKLTLRDVQLQTKDGCTWVLSVNTKGLSAWDYVRIRSNRTIASRGALVSTKQV